MGRFKVLHSSAGAGKTHALVKEYLLLALKHGQPGDYAHILALTFTNKAAGEMRERVLEYLEALASGTQLTKATEKDVQAAVMERAGIDAEELVQRARAMLTHMLHNWGRVAISTIDAFTRRVVMPFKRELQLDQDLNMTVEEEYYRGKAVDRLLERAGNEPGLTEVLVATCEQMLEAEQSWRVDKPLMAISEQLTQEQALRHLKELKSTTSARFLEIQRQLGRDTDAFREKVRAMGKKVLKTIADAGIDRADMAGGAKGVSGYFRKLAEFDTGTDFGKSGPNALETGTWSASKASAQARSLIDGLAPLFEETVREVEAMRNGAMRNYLIQKAILEDLLPMATLSEIGGSLEDLKREEGVSFFSDLTRKVMEVVQDEPAPFLYERMGERYRHFLVDEFQDTSLMQWHAMLPLVENALSEGGSVLLVGDAKQAIYRWRNGEVRQFRDFPKVFGGEALKHVADYEQALKGNYAGLEPLNTNRRSASGIIRFNNDLIAALKPRLDQEEQRMYDRHEQETFKTTEGYVEVTCYGKADPEEGTDDGGMDPPWALMIKAVEESLADGFGLGDIAVLVRSGKQGAQAGHHLTVKGWKVIAPNGLVVGGSKAALAVVNMLSWLQYPSDETAAPAAQSVAMVRHAGAETVNPFAQGKTPDSLLKDWQQANPLIHVRQPLVQLIVRIARALGHDPATDRFILTLVNAAHAFTQANGDDLPGFLEFWERSAKNTPIGGTPGGDAIQVMTIHKAKGLEFPVVIIPEAGKMPGNQNQARIWFRPAPPVEGLPWALVKQGRLQSSKRQLGVPEAVEEERLSQLDDLNVFYVAITRAGQRLYISVPAARQSIIGQGICEHLKLKADDCWSSSAERPKKVVELGASGEREPVMELRPLAVNGEMTLAISKEAPEEWDPGAPDHLRSRGKAIHAVLARVHAPGDLQQAIHQERDIWGLTTEEAAALENMLAVVLGKAELAPFYGEGLDVHTEATLIDEEGHAWRPDRIVGDGKQLRVLDIKTGKQFDAHKAQVRNYVRLLREVQQLPVEGFLLYLREGEVVPVENA